MPHVTSDSTDVQSVKSHFRSLHSQIIPREWEMISTLLQSYYNPLLDEVFAEPDEALTTFQSHFQTELFMLKWLLRHKRLASCLIS